MNTERLRKIIEYTESNREDIESKVKNFYSFAGMSNANDVLNILQIVRSSFRKKGYLVLEIPFCDKEIGALCYRGDALGYIVVNTSLSKVNTNFAICHEVYHVFYQANDFKSKVEFADNHYYEHEEEYAANLFAGTLLMPKASLAFMYNKFKIESSGNELDTIIRLMNYYQVPYMAALIRCYELDLPEANSISEELLSVSRAVVRDKFIELWLDDSILDATRKDDYEHIEDVVKKFGAECINDSYMSEQTLAKVLQNMRALYSEIRGE